MAGNTYYTKRWLNLASLLPHVGKCFCSVLKESVLDNVMAVIGVVAVAHGRRAGSRSFNDPFQLPFCTHSPGKLHHLPLPRLM